MVIALVGAGLSAPFRASAQESDSLFTLDPDRAVEELPPEVERDTAAEDDTAAEEARAPWTLMARHRWEGRGGQSADDGARDLQRVQGRIGERAEWALQWASGGGSTAEVGRHLRGALAVPGKGPLARLHLGDLRWQVGEGLLLADRSQPQRRPAPVAGALRGWNGVRADLAREPPRPLRGLALTLGSDRWEATAMAAGGEWRSAAGPEGEPSHFYEGGSSRVRVRCEGLALSARRGAAGGVTILSFSLSPPVAFASGEGPYARQTSRELQWGLWGRWERDAWAVAAEWGWGRAGWGLVARGSWTGDPASILIIHRLYTPGFAPLLGAPFSAGSSAGRNESGTYCGLRWRSPAGAPSILPAGDLYIDVHRTLWRTTTVPFPATEVEGGGALRWPLGVGGRGEVRWKLRSGEEGAAPAEEGIALESERARRLSLRYIWERGGQEMILEAARTEARSALGEAGSGHLLAARWSGTSRERVQCSLSVVLFTAPGSAPVPRVEGFLPGLLRSERLSGAGDRWTLRVRVPLSSDFLLSGAVRQVRRRPASSGSQDEEAWEETSRDLAVQLDWSLP